MNPISYPTETTRNIITVDPGETGAMAITTGDQVHGSKIYVFDYGSRNIPVELRVIKNYGYEVYVENVHAMPGQGVSSMFKFGKNLGWWLGMFDGLGFSIEMLEPRVWLKEVYTYHGEIKRSIPLPCYKDYSLMGKNDKKKSNVYLARTLFGLSGLDKFKYNGRADALLMMDHVIRRKGGEA